MSGFISWLEELNGKDTKVRAVLRRSLAFPPGNFPAAYPYVEPFVKNADGWRRDAHYLTAGLWATHWRENHGKDVLSIGNACSIYRWKTESENIERRFIALLDADETQLTHRLRQMIVLLKDYSIDFESMLQDLLYWNNDRKITQNRWARDFYRDSQTELATNEEVVR